MTAMTSHGVQNKMIENDLDTQILQNTSRSIEIQQVHVWIHLVKTDYLMHQLTYLNVLTYDIFYSFTYSTVQYSLKWHLQTTGNGYVKQNIQQVQYKQQYIIKQVSQLYRKYILQFFCPITVPNCRKYVKNDIVKIDLKRIHLLFCGLKNSWVNFQKLVSNAQIVFPISFYTYSQLKQFIFLMMLFGTVVVLHL
ncbi:Hypothetical_protein [Hexamita inflata]|uniref:Hypothetical_protein n=1 Tax=Hexamita inflata TaxID=28002 RepID=A0AA86UIZ0_9EUKA|nr:Hypothetical protein HINF_LOCUS29463 [Hexamita inflata]